MIATISSPLIVFERSSTDVSTKCTTRFMLLIVSAMLNTSCPFKGREKRGRCEDQCTEPSKRCCHCNEVTDGNARNRRQSDPLSLTDGVAQNQQDCGAGG